MNLFTEIQSLLENIQKFLLINFFIKKISTKIHQNNNHSISLQILGPFQKIFFINSFFFEIKKVITVASIKIYKILKIMKIL